MSVTKNQYSLIFKIIIIGVSFWGLLLNSGYPETFTPQMFLYYTILSNALCFCYFLLALSKQVYGYVTYNTKPLNMRVKGAVTLAITVTMTIYWLVLVPAGFVMGEGSTMWANLIVHLIVPVLVILDWLLFDKKGEVTKLDPLWWLIIPLCYYCFTVIGYFLNVTYIDGSHYPYFFIDSELLGWGTVGINIIVLVIAFLIMGYFVYFIDNRLGRISTKRN